MLTSFDDALALVLGSITREMPRETVPLVLALDRVLGAPIVANEDVPASANSAMDGFAIRAEDVTAASTERPIGLRVIGESAAGAPFPGVLSREDAVRIMTGGVVPRGADAVVEIESTSEADGIVQVRRPVDVGTSIRLAGEDIATGQEVIAAGKTITPGDIGVLASLGVSNVPVRVKPKVGLIATGNELVEAHQRPRRGQLRNSSLPALYALTQQAGAEPIDLGIATDDREDLIEHFESGLRYDVMVTTGGVSAGLYDLVQHLLPELGVEVKFHRVNIRPGKPVLFGTYGDGDERTLVFGLPGNPVSSLVTFRQFVIPALRALLQSTEPPRRLKARTQVAIAKQDDKRHFVRGILSRDVDGNLVVTTTGSQSSGVMRSMSLANCLIIVPESERSIAEGNLVDVEML